MTQVESRPSNRGSFSGEGASDGLLGLLSPRFLASNPSRNRRKHFRGSTDFESHDTEGSSVDEPQEDVPEDLVIDIVDVEQNPTDGVSPTSDAGFKTPRESPSEKKRPFSARIRRGRKNSDPGDMPLESLETGDSKDSGSFRKKERDRRSTVGGESDRPLIPSFSQENVQSPCTTSSGSSAELSDSSSQAPAGGEMKSPRMPMVMTSETKFEEIDEQPSTSRKARQRTLQRSARMSPQEIRSIMNTVESPRDLRDDKGFRRLAPESVSTDLISPRYGNYVVRSLTTTPRTTVSTSSPLLASKVLGSFHNLARDTSDEFVSPLCTPHGETPSTTPKAISETVITPHEAAGHNFRNQEKPRHGHARFFSTSTLKATKPNASQKKVSTNPSSPVVGKSPTSAGSPEQRVFSMTLEEVVKEPDLCGMFMAFLERMNATEGLEFLIKLESLRMHEAQAGGEGSADLIKEALSMCEEFIREGAEKELNLSRSTRETIEANLVAPEAASNPNPSVLFQEARVEVFNMLGTNMYSLWLSSLH